MTPIQLKEKFRREGKTFAQWARDNGYKPYDVSLVVSGFRRGTRGKCHEIAVKLGLKPDTAKSST